MRSMLSFPVLSRPRTALRAHSPLQAHALLGGAESLTQHCEGSPVAAAVGDAVAGRTPVSALDLAATGFPLGAVLAEVGVLSDSGALRVHRPLGVGDPAAASILADLESESAESPCAGAVSLKVAVVGPGAHGVATSLGRSRFMEGVVDRLPGYTPRPWVFTRVAAGAGVVYVVADDAAPQEEAWYQLLRGAVGLVVTADGSAQSWSLVRRAVAEARVVGLRCVLAGAVTPEDVRDELDEVVPIATSDPGTASGAHAALRLLAHTIEAGGQR